MKVIFHRFNLSLILFSLLLVLPTGQRAQAGVCDNPQTAWMCGPMCIENWSSDNGYYCNTNAGNDCSQSCGSGGSNFSSSGDSCSCSCCSNGATQ